jgi:hypothetical protein
MDRLAGTGFAATDCAALCCSGATTSTTRGLANCNCTKLRSPHRDSLDLQESQGRSLEAAFPLLAQTSRLLVRVQPVTALAPPSHPATHAGASAASTAISTMAVMEARRITILDIVNVKKLLLNLLPS